MKIDAPHNQRILMVDDNEDVRTALIGSLTQRGYHCVGAEHGASALQLLNSDRFHLVITDYRMPSMDGLQFLEVLKKRPAHSLPPVILMTADMSEKLREHALALGVYAVIAKPFAPQKLAVLAAHAIESGEIDQRRLRKTSGDLHAHVTGHLYPFTRR